MKRTIKFKGYNLKNKQWLYGYYLVNRGKHYIVQDETVNPFAEAEDFEVDEESVGQWMANVDGVDLYEGDYVDRIELRYFEGETYPVFRLKGMLKYYPETHLVMFASIDDEKNVGYIKTASIFGEDRKQFKYEVVGNEYEKNKCASIEDLQKKWLDSMREMELESALLGIKNKDISTP